MAKGMAGMAEERAGWRKGRAGMMEEKAGWRKGMGVGVMGWDFVYSTVTRSRMLSTVSIPMPFTSSRASALVKSPFASL